MPAGRGFAAGLVPAVSAVATPSARVEMASIMLEHLWCSSLESDYFQLSQLRLIQYNDRARNSPAADAAGMRKNQRPA